MELSDNERTEEIAEEIHNIWLRWAKKLLESEQNISEERKKRWQEECFKPYSELTEQMKDRDRKYATQILNRINLLS
ncbi:MAG: RyR domain-containing protein [Bacteroidota bacterium]